LTGECHDQTVVEARLCAYSGTPWVPPCGAAFVAAGAQAKPGLVLGHHFVSAGPPPTSSQCIATLKIACYDPQDMRNQYDFNPEYAAGHTGTGQTIVIFDSFGSPTIGQDLGTFDSSYNIPPPPAFNIYTPEGNVTYPYEGASPSAVKKSKNFQTQIGWGYETTLDVEWAHAMAPGANIALVETPVAETQGVQGLQNLQNAQKWALDNHIGNTWWNSYATTEQAFHKNPVIERMNGFYRTAANDGISGFYATGDSGVANTDKQGSLFPYPTVNFPTSSPDVIAVGARRSRRLSPPWPATTPRRSGTTAAVPVVAGSARCSVSPPTRARAGSPTPAGCAVYPMCPTTRL
jgi:subtilase family serine protease